MKFKGILTLCMAGFALSAAAQTHVEGEEYYKADQFANAKDLLLRSLNNAGTDKAVSDYYLGLIALRDNNKSEAQKYFENGVQANPDYAYNYVGLGQLALAGGNAKGAEEQFKMAEKLGKEDKAGVDIAIARAYYNIDPVLYEKQISKNVEKARKASKNNSPEVYLFEGDKLAANKDWGGAAAQYEMATTYDPNASEAYVKYANLFTMVNPDYAITMLKKLLDVNPNSALAQRELANAYYNKKDFRNAASEYGKYVQNPSHFKSDEDRYAFLLFYSGDFQKGYDYASKLLQKNPQNFTAQRYQFMNAAQIPGMKDQLLPLAEALLAAHNANPEKNKMAAIDYTLIADELDKAKKTDEAIAVLQSGIKEMPDNANFNKQLAMTYVNLNNLTKAAEAYHGYLEKSEKPGYNDFIQQATFSFYAGVENKDNPAAAEKFYKETGEYADKAAEIMPDNYKPVMFKGDIAKQTAATADAAKSAAAPYYEKAIKMLEASSDPSRYTRDAKTMYVYLGNYYLDQNDSAKAKEYYNGNLKLSPNDEEFMKFVDGIK